MLMAARCAAAVGPVIRVPIVFAQPGCSPRIWPEIARAAATPLVIPHLSKPVAR